MNEINFIAPAGANKTISFLVPTIGRESLTKTLASIETLPGDEILVIGNMVSSADPRVRCIPCRPGHDYGSLERNVAMPLAKGDYLAFLDDDDVYAPGHRALMAEVMETNRPALFRMRFPNGITLWQDKIVRCGNFGTPCIFVPNVPEKLGHWESFVGGDCAFFESCKWERSEIVWRPEVIALLGHNI